MMGLTIFESRLPYIVLAGLESLDHVHLDMFEVKVMFSETVANETGPD